MQGPRLIAVCCALFLLSGCVQYNLGRNFDLELFSQQIQRGVSTKAEVTQWLGAPVSQGLTVNSKGEQLTRWLYYYSHGRLTHLEAASMKTLEVQFDDKGIVQAYDWLSDK